MNKELYKEFNDYCKDQIKYGGCKSTYEEWLEKI
jgi:hypothetical protein